MLLGLLIVTAFSAPQTEAQSADALLDKLVEKGVLTVDEANELREQSDNNFTQAYQVKTGLPDYVSSFRLYGDVRLRYEGFYSGLSYTNSGGTEDFVARNRGRFRLRFGATATFLENFEAGFRLTSAEDMGEDFGGDPISGNSTFNNNASKKFIYIDQAYGRWTPLNGPQWYLSTVVGKMESPYVFEDLVLDPDYTPEGAAIQTSYRLNDNHAIKFTTGAYVLDEFRGSSHDPYTWISQVRWDGTLNEHLSASAGASYLLLEYPERLTADNVPDGNSGNTRDADGVLVHDYNPYVLDAAFTYTLESFPHYNGRFPIKLAGTYLYNPGAPSDADNYAWQGGLIFGKAGKKRTWELSYTYKWLGGDSWYEEVVDSDFGAFYGSAESARNFESGVGYAAGTNVKGHILRLAYAPADSLTLSVKWFASDLIDNSPGDRDSHMNRIQVDGIWKF